MAALPKLWKWPNCYTSYSPMTSAVWKTRFWTISTPLKSLSNRLSTTQSSKISPLKNSPQNVAKVSPHSKRTSKSSSTNHLTNGSSDSDWCTRVCCWFQPINLSQRLVATAASQTLLTLSNCSRKSIQWLRQTTVHITATAVIVVNPRILKSEKTISNLQITYRINLLN